jgi:hypothetical protein
LTFINVTEGKKKIIGIIEELAKHKKVIKIIGRVDLATVENLEKLNSINNKIGREAVEMRHCRQPLRGFIIDNKIARLKEEKVSEKYKPGELKKNTRIFYEIYDEEWVSWLQKVFWELFRNSISSNKRLEILKSITPTS